MQDPKNIIDCYNKTANNYAEHFKDELDKKHLDRILLSAFASGNKNKGKLIDLGCGPGHTTQFLKEQGMKEVIGMDISPAMTDTAGSLNPGIEFFTGDMLTTGLAPGSFGSAIAFYAIVHFDHEHVLKAFREVKRILIEGGEFLFSFHVGEQTLHLDSLLDHEVNIDFHFFDKNRIIELVTEAGFELIDAIERAPYPDAEYASNRAYIWVRAKE